MNSKQPTPRSNRRARAKSVEKYQRILDAAAKVLCEQGYAETTLSDIARAAGTHAGSLYYYFPSREDLITEVLLTAVDRMSELSLSLATDEPQASSLDRVSNFVREIIDQLTAMRNDYYLRAYLRNYDHVPDSVREALKSRRRQVRHSLSDLIREAQAAGEIPEQTDVNIATQFIVGATNWVGLWYQPSGPVPPEVITETFLDLMLHGLRGSQESKGRARE